MANLNKVMLIGRLTRDPESRAFNNGGKVVKFGFAVNNRRKNQQTGEWLEEPASCLARKRLFDCGHVAAAGNRHADGFFDLLYQIPIR